MKNLALSVLASTLLFLNSCGTAAQASEAETDGLVVANVVCPMVPAHEADAEVTEPRKKKKAPTIRGLGPAFCGEEHDRFNHRIDRGNPE